MTGVWATNDVISSTRMNEKTVFQGTGAAISGLTTYSGMLAFCTSSGSGFVLNKLYQRNTANDTWIAIGVSQAGDQVYPLDTTIGNYTSQTAIGNSRGFISTDAAYIKQNLGLGTISFHTDVTGLICYKDIGAGLISDSAFNLRFKYVCSTFSATSASIQRLAICLSSNASDISTANDSLGFGIRVDSAGSSYHAIYGDGGTPIASQQNFAESVGVETFYIEIKRTSTTSFTVSLYSDSGYSSLVEAEVVTIPATLTGLRYFKLVNLSEAATNNFLGEISDIYLTYSSATHVPDVTLLDNSNQNNPYEYTDMGSAKELHALAIKIDKTTTTETEIQIRASTDTTFTSGETVRTLTVSDFTDDTYRFITIPRAITDKRYIQVYGSSTGVILVLTDVKHLTKTAADFEKGHFHKYLEPTDTSANSLDGNA